MYDISSDLLDGHPEATVRVPGRVQCAAGGDQHDKSSPGIAETHTRRQQTSGNTTAGNYIESETSFYIYLAPCIPSSIHRQFAQSSIVQLETTRTSQQAQIQTLHSQVLSLDVTVAALGQFVAQLAERHPQLELPGEIRRICHQVVAEAAQQQQRKKLPIFVERKIGKSMSVNAQLGFPLKVLEEMNEMPSSPQHQPHGPVTATAATSSSSSDASPVRASVAKPTTGKTPFFENTYQKIRQQQQARPQRLLDAAPTPVASVPSLPSTTNGIHPTPAEMRLPEYVERAIESMTSPRQVDSGISTPVSPPLSTASSSLALLSPVLSPTVAHRPQVQMPSSASRISMPATGHVPESPSPIGNGAPQQPPQLAQHPLSNCEDVHFTFNGTTTQLKTFRPVHHSHTSHLGGGASIGTTETTVAAASKAIDAAGAADGKNGRS